MPSTVHHGTGSAISHTPSSGSGFQGVVSNSGNTLDIYYPIGGDDFVRRTYTWNDTLHAWVRTAGGSTWIIRYFDDGTYTQTQDGIPIANGTHTAVA